MKPYYEDKWGVIYLGDCREILPRLDVKVDLVLTDPPWNLGYFQDDEKPWGEYREWLEDIRDMCLSSGEVVWIFQSTKAVPYVSDLFKGWGMFASCKNFCQMVPTVIANAFDVAFFNSSNGFVGIGRNWHIGQNPNIANTSKHHPTARPLDTVSYIISLYSAQTILDPFLGSGTTAVCAKKLNRHYIGIEIEEKYCEIAAKRLSQEVFDFRV